MITYFIEHKDSQEWYTGSGWTSDPHIAKNFDSPDEAHDFLLTVGDLLNARTGIMITEHEFPNTSTPPTSTAIPT